MTKRSLRYLTAVATGVLATTALLAGCVPGSGGGGDDQDQKAVTSKPDPAKAGDVTLRVWDQEVRGGQNKTMKALNKAFEKKYPNVTIKRTSRSFSDLRTTLKLALTDNDPPDVVQANQGYGSMVAFADADLLRPIDDYAKVFGWEDYFPKTLLDLNRVNTKKKSFGHGTLYGLSQSGEYIGIYYDKDVLASAGVPVPKTWEEFLSSLDTLKAKGVLPIQFGNLDKYPAIHTFGVIQDHIGDYTDIRETVFGDGPGFDNEQTTSAAKTLAEWAKIGIIPPTANGLGYDAAAKKFAAGQGAYLVTGTWELADLRPTMGDALGFMAPPRSRGADGPVTTGGEGLAWSITSKSKHPDVAAAYIDFITNAHASTVMTENGVLPIVPGSAADALKSGSAEASMFAGWTALNENDGLVPYLDYTTPTFYDTLTEQLQKLIDGRVSAQEFAAALQKNYHDFHAKK